jgi:hypothetical protein
LIAERGLNARPPAWTSFVFVGDGRHAYCHKKTFIQPRVSTPMVFWEGLLHASTSAACCAMEPQTISGA